MADSWVDHDAVRGLADILDEKDLTEIEYEADGRRIRVARADAASPQVIAAPDVPAPIAADSALAADVSVPATDDTQEIKSPMVGTFYVAASPDEPPFVEVGKRVTVGQVVCIIEAMKLMNEIESEYDGVVTERLVQDAEGVEFDQTLFRVAVD